MTTRERDYCPGEDDDSVKDDGPREGNDLVKDDGPREVMIW